ncbi:MFS general substrate transporter [Ascodesmis nigricans]|uniref:Autophagy-related protein n=1 Tax=Ascodesmis nigricans TaxID=341454 RepID=A0A4S2N6H3_9PEZI|nr:MFS general substrate transporter [Ascodesmis nigricans]
MSGHHYAPISEPNDPEDADDERSLSDLDESDFLDDRNPRRQTAPAFPGQDLRPTSQKELMGWYSYAWAAEVFVVCGISSFIPMTLEQLARENGVLLSDGVTPCAEATKTFEGGIPGIPGDHKDGQCVVYILGARINTASLAMYTFSISVFLQSLLIISMSGAADHGAYRKRLLLIFAIMGSIATMLFFIINSDVYLLASVWAIIGNIGFGASFVLLNAFLPVLVRNHPKILYPEPASPQQTPATTEGHTLLTNEPSLNGYARNTHSFPKDVLPNPTSPALALSTQISSYGIAIGYGAAVLVQIFSIFVVMATKSTTASLQLVLFIIGIWWFIFTIPVAIWLRPRPGPPLPKLPGVSSQSWWRYIQYSWVGLYRTILRARRLRDVMYFLAAWFLLSDGVATVSGTAILFAKTELKMPAPAVALISVISTVSGVVGAFAWPQISKLFHKTPSQTILIIILVFLSIPCYALLGFIPAIKQLGFGGLTQPWEMYLLGGVYGFVLGGISSYCRSIFGELIPPGSEAAFYALYAVTDKGSSIFGPAIVGALTDKYGDIRVAFWFLAALLAAPVPLIMAVDVQRGKREGRELALEEMVESRRR